MMYLQFNKNNLKFASEEVVLNKWNLGFFCFLYFLACFVEEEKYVALYKLEFSLLLESSHYFWAK